jgi:hypothetical protein
MTREVTYREEAFSVVATDKEQEMNAIEKSIRRHQEKAALREKQQRKKGGPVPWGCGMGWPERKDFATEAEYIAARRAADPNYTPNHDGRLWPIV